MVLTEAQGIILYFHVALVPDMPLVSIQRENLVLDSSCKIVGGLEESVIELYFIAKQGKTFGTTVEVVLF